MTDKETSKRSNRMAAKLSLVKRLILRRAAQSEPRAMVLDDPELNRQAEQLVEERLVGKVTVRDNDAYRLTEFGRATLAALEMP